MYLIFGMTLPTALAAAEDTDSYTKEETKSTKFINLTHAASLTRQPSQSPLTSPPPPPPPAGSGRMQAAASGTLPRQFSSSHISESGFDHCQPKVGEDGWETAGSPWVGSPSGSSWLARASSSHAQPSASLPSLPVPPSADEQVCMGADCAPLHCADKVP